MDKKRMSEYSGPTSGQGDGADEWDWHQCSDNQDCLLDLFAGMMVPSNMSNGRSRIHHGTTLEVNVEYTPDI
jgi:hypothetical protein